MRAVEPDAARALRLVAESERQRDKLAAALEKKVKSGGLSPEALALAEEQLKLL